MDVDLLQYMTGHDSAGDFITTVSGTAQHPTANNLNGEFLKANQLDATDFGSLGSADSASAAYAASSIPLEIRLLAQQRCQQLLSHH